MLIVETPAFTRRITKLLSDDEYRSLQNHLLVNPQAGKMIAGSGGLRKVRWGISGRGKRGGIRVIYYYIVRKSTILLLIAFAKNEWTDLTKSQLNTLRKLVQEELG